MPDQDPKNALVMLGKRAEKTVPLADWHLTTLGNLRGFGTRMQLSGWLPKEWRMRREAVTSIVGEQYLRQVVLPGKYATITIEHAKVDVEVQRVGAERLFVKMVWAHTDDDQDPDDHEEEPPVDRILKLRDLITDEGGAWTPERVLLSQNTVFSSCTRTTASRYLRVVAQRFPWMIQPVTSTPDTWEAVPD